MKKHSTEVKVIGAIGRCIQLHQRVLHDNQASKHASCLQQWNASCSLYWGGR